MRGCGEGGFGQVVVARGSAGVAREWWERATAKRGEATREDGPAARLVAEVHVVPAGSSECRA